MLPAVTLSFLLGLSLGSYLPFFPVTVISSLSVATAFVFFLEFRRALVPFHGTVILSCLFGGCLYWTVFAWVTDRPPILDQPGRSTTQIEGQIAQSVRHAPGRLTAQIHVTACDNPAIQLPFDLRLTWRDPDIDLAQGMNVRMRAHIRPPSGSVNPRGFDYAEYLDGQGIDAVAALSGPGALTILGAEATMASALSGRLERWRGAVRRAADSLEQPARSLFLSLTIGEQGYLPPDVREWFMTTGTVHILSISGSHLGLIALLTYGFVKRLCLRLPAPALLTLSRRIIPSRLAALVTMVPVLGYTLLAGAETATIRSCIMIAIGLLTVWCGYPRYVLHALAASAWLALAVNPHVLYDLSFQLSYGSVLVLAWAWDTPVGTRQPEAPDRRFWSRLTGWLWESLRLTGYVTLATLPLVAFYFNQVPWMGLLANLLVVPFVGIIVLPICLLSAGWVIATDSATLPAGELIQNLANGLIQGVHILADLPGAEWFVAAPSLPMMCLFYALGWRLLRAGASLSSTAMRAVMALGMALILAWWLWSPRPFPSQDHVRMTFLDVGQGDSAVVEMPSERVLVIDGGATYERFDMGRGVLAPFLWNRGIRRIDHLVGTHPQLDHVGGLTWVLGHFEIGTFWTNGLTRQEEFWQQLERAVARRHVEPVTASPDREIPSIGPCRVTFLNPPADRSLLSGREARSLNNQSVVTQIVCGERRFLFTGDIEREGLLRLSQSGPVQPLAVLKIPHHGSRSSLESSWLHAAAPKVAIVSAGRNNAYGHPAGEVLSAYEAVGAQVHRTDREGAIWVDVDLNSGRLQVHSMDEWRIQRVALSSGGIPTEWDNLARLWRRWNWL